LFNCIINRLRDHDNILPMPDPRQFGSGGELPPLPRPHPQHQQHTSPGTTTAHLAPVGSAATAATTTPNHHGTEKHRSVSRSDVIAKNSMEDGEDGEDSPSRDRRKRSHSRESRHRRRRRRHRRHQEPIGNENGTDTDTYTDTNIELATGHADGNDAPLGIENDEEKKNPVGRQLMGWRKRQRKRKSRNKSNEKDSENHNRDVVPVPKGHTKDVKDGAGHAKRMEKQRKNRLEPGKITVRDVVVFRGLYSFMVQHWMSTFPRDQMLFLYADEMFVNPANTMAEISTYLSIDRIDWAHIFDKNKVHGDGPDAGADADADTDAEREEEGGKRRRHRRHRRRKRQTAEEEEEGDDDDETQGEERDEEDAPAAAGVAVGSRKVEDFRGVHDIHAIEKAPPSKEVVAYLWEYYAPFSTKLGHLLGKPPPWKKPAILDSS